jgi:hypothetical protein
MKAILVLALVVGWMAVASGQVYYDPDVVALISLHGCGSCHGGSGGLFVIPYDSIMSSGNHGPVVTPFDTNSIIVQKLKGTAAFGSRMPFGGPFMSDEEIEVVVRWIAGGALNSKSTSIAVIDAGVPPPATLFQNYPNPFNPTTTIRCRLATTGSVKLAVYDLLGREVKVLMEGVKQPGTYDAEFSRAALPSGLYLYRLDAPGIHETRKMIILL